MSSVPGGPIGPPLAGDAGTSVPLQAVDLTAIADAPWPSRGAAAFALVLVVGGGLLWRRRAFVERSIAASTDRPLASLGYGIAAHAVIAFAGVYLASRLVRAGGLGRDAGLVGAMAGGVLMLIAAGLGFTVVGAVLAGLGGRGQGVTGAVVGAFIAGGVAAVEPSAGALAWFVVVSTGIGGPVREWVHASAGPDV